MNNFRKHLLLYCKTTFQRTDNQSEISAENQIQKPEKKQAWVCGQNFVAFIEANSKSAC
jgi:hypothetical protein